MHIASATRSPQAINDLLHDSDAYEKAASDDRTLAAIQAIARDNAPIVLRGNTLQRRFYFVHHVIANVHVQRRRVSKTRVRAIGFSRHDPRELALQLTP